MRAASKSATAKGQPKRSAEPVDKGDENGAEKRHERGIKAMKEVGKARRRTPNLLKIITLRDKRLVKRMVEPIKSITFAPAFMHKTIL